MRVDVIATGLANLASVRAALARAGAEVATTLDPEVVRTSRHVVLPGVGALGPAMAALSSDGIDEALRERISQGRPLLAICLGLQLLCEASEESPERQALGVFSGVARRFSAGPGIAVPHLGWNRVEAERCRILRSGYAAFAHSYRLECAPDGTEAAWSEHGGRFVAAFERGSLVACQFHPELSGAYGAGIVERWLAC